jgi:hypothetical protein
MPKTCATWLTTACCTVTCVTLGFATASCGTSSDGTSARTPTALPPAVTSPVTSPGATITTPVQADPDADKTPDSISTPADVPDVNNRDSIPGEGRFLIGTDIQPGEYVSQGNGTEGTCKWKRLASDKGGTYTTVIAKGENLTTNTIVVIDPQDGAFESTNCMDWKLVHD